MRKIHDLKLRYQNESVADSYDDERFSSLPGRVFNALEKRAIVRAVRHVRQDIPNPVVLDLPCGTGRITETLLCEGLRVTGGDISLEMMRVAERRCARFGDRLQLTELDLDDLQLPSKSFDLVCCIKLLHHFDTTARTAILLELTRVCRAYVLVSVSFSNAFYRWRRRLKRRLGLGVAKNSSTWPEICREADAVGLRVHRKYWVAPFIGEDLLLLLRRREDT